MAMRPTINRHQIELDEYAFALLSARQSNRLGLESPVSLERGLVT
jgi:hypothetical protein